MNINNIPNDVKKILTLLNTDNYEAYMVGGCVRDLLLNKDPHDWDMCTNATPTEMMKFCKKHNLSYIPTGLKHGTITIMINGEGYELTTYRIDGEYTDNRRPNTVTFSNNLIEDLSRRDFTINAIAADVKGNIVDPFNGQVDLENKILKTVGDPYKRFSEDALRLLRALRFAIRYDLKIDKETGFAIHELKENINTVSKERITDEFKKIFSYNKPIYKYFTTYRDLITCIIPEIKNCINFEQNNKFHKHNVYNHMLAVTDLVNSNKFEIKMAALLHDIGKPNCYTEDELGNGHFYGHPKISKSITEQVLKNDFRVSNNEYNLITSLVEEHDRRVADTKKAVKRFLNEYSIDFINDWLILKQADIDDHIIPKDVKINWGDISHIYKHLKEIIEEDAAFSIKSLKINGNDLIDNLDLKPGKEIGMILNSLLEEVINENVLNNKEDLLEEARNIYYELKDSLER